MGRVGVVETVADTNGLTIGGRYRVERLLGEGAMKRVYLARDLVLDRDVALSVLKTEDLDAGGLGQLRDEARAVARLGTHPHVVTVFDLGIADGRLYLSTEYACGGDLRHRLDAAPERRLPIEEALRLADQICLGLAHAHAAGLVHRDLGPGNVWLAGDGAAKVGDFGIAVSLARSRALRDGRFVTAVAYMAPEVALGQPPSPQSDLYSLGALLYEMLAGRPPFRGDDNLAVLAQHIHTPPVAPSCHRADLPAAFDVLVLHLLAKTPGERPDGTMTVRALLAAVPNDATTTRSDPAHPLARFALGAFVGREPVMRELRHAVEDAMAGRGSVVFLTGEAGIGKTRTAQAIATYARLRQMAVAVGRCQEGEGAPAYWPWLQALRAPDATLPLPLLAMVAPEPTDSRARLFDAVVTHLSVRAATQPLLLVIDDVHWADQASALLLRFVAQSIAESPLLVVATYRDTELPAGDPLATIGRRLHLSALTAGDVERLIELITGQAPDAALARAVYERTAGNPFFVGEVVRLLATSPAGALSPEVPAGVRGVILERLARLSPDARAVLEAAAAMGREVDVEVVARVVAVPAVLDRLDEAIEARLLERDRDTPARVRFSHLLVRDCLYDDLGSAVRGRLHRAIAEAIAERWRDDLGPHHAALEHHFARAGDPHRAAAHAEEAARRAAGQLAFEDAAAHYEAALTMLAPSDASGRGRLLLALGRTRIRAGERARAREAFKQAGDLGRRIGAGDLLAHAALGMAGHGEVAAGVDDTLIGLLEAALIMLPVADGALRARVTARLAMALCFSDARDRAVALSRDALAMAERLGDDGVLAFALVSRHLALWGPGNPEERLAIADRQIPLAEAAGPVEVARFGHLFRLIDALELGDIRSVDAEMQHFVRLLDVDPDPFHHWQLVSTRCMRAVLEGRFDDAERLLAEGLELGQRVQSPNVLLRHAVHLFGLRRAQCRLAELEATASAMVERLPGFPALRASLAALYAALERPAESRVHFEQLAAGDFADLRRDATWLGTMSELARVCAFLGDTPRASLLYDLLLPCRHHVVVISFAHGCEGAVARYLGLLATTMGRYDEAAVHFEAAIARNARLGAAPLVADTRGDYARMLMARGRDTDRTLAAALVTDAAATYVALGLAVPAARVRAIIAAADAQPIPAPRADANVMRRDGPRWTIRHAGHEAALRDGKGVRTLALLLASPERDLHVLELHALLDGSDGATCSRARSDVEDEPILDARARAELATRLRDLYGEIDEAERFSDLGRREHLRVEIEQIEHHLATALGLGGHARRIGGPIERARKAVYNRLRATIAAIDEAHPTLARHLARSVRTGTFCSYRPERPVSWDVVDARASSVSVRRAPPSRGGPCRRATT